MVGTEKVAKDPKAVLGERTVDTVPGEDLADYEEEIDSLNRGLDRLVKSRIRTTRENEDYHNSSNRGFGQLVVPRW